jgi:hypothetical protein
MHSPIVKAAKTSDAEKAGLPVIRPAERAPRA